MENQNIVIVKKKYTALKIITALLAVAAVCLVAYKLYQKYFKKKTEELDDLDDLELLDAVCRAVSVPVIASGGAGCIDHFTELFRALPRVDAGLAASIFHFGDVAIPDLKAALRAEGIPVRI